MDGTGNVIAFLHVIFPLIISLYCLWAPPILDNLYVIYFIGLNISWLVFKDECLVSYVYKKLKQSDYKLGDDPSVADYDNLLGKNNAKIFVFYLLVMYLVNMVFVISRVGYTNITRILLVVSTFMYVVYVILFRINKKLLIYPLHILVYVITLIAVIYEIFK